MPPWLHFATDVALRAVIDVFIVVSVFWMIFWDAGLKNPFRRYWIPKIQGLFLWLGISGEWRMFSPDPPDRTIWPMAKLTLKNGDVVRWEPTPHGDLSVLERARYKRFHKFFHEVTRPHAGFQLKRDFVEYLLHTRLHEQPCSKVELYLVAQRTPPFHAPSSETKPVKALVYTFYPAEPEPR